ncbi:MAG TPA: heparan-alpha-glucosaminide N-acetyltransferase domain-containing protein [Terriglobales bacterium]|nr:heparan-alpha-glucosaminide N-acetyltransferase domain-containing protein [Terriglobales bacterium]
MSLAERGATRYTLAVPSASSRLSWIDWMRGLACVLMFQTHCYDSWLGGDARNGSFLHWSQRLGTFPAPLFLFLAGISFALVTTKLIRKNQTPGEITRTMVLRGAEIVAFGLAFRLQEYVIAWGWAPWTDLFRVDVLNVIGLSMIFMALMCGAVLRLATSREVSATGQLPVAPLVATSLAIVAAIALVTPPLYTTWRPTWLPWQIESYIDGCHNLGAPQPWLFSIFPWTAFAFAGLAAGFILFSEQAREHTAKIMAAFAAIGATAIGLAYALDHSSFHLYSTYDYWHTSPNFLMMRIGMLLMICLLAYAWTRWLLPSLGTSSAGPWAVRFSPLIQLGQTSLLVYWVHIEFVYGRFSILPKRAVGVATATRGLIEICVFMLLLSIARTRLDWKKIDWSRFNWKGVSGSPQGAETRKRALARIHDGLDLGWQRPSSRDELHER